MPKPVEEVFYRVAPKVDFCSLRLVEERSESLCVRQGVLQPPVVFEDRGAMITVVEGEGMGYAATSDLTEDGLCRAAKEALAWARRSARLSIFPFSRVSFPRPRGEYVTPVQIPWSTVSLKDKVDLLRAECERLKVDGRIVDWAASLWHTESRHLYLTAGGGRVEQLFSFMVPMLRATAYARGQSQTRTFGGRGFCRQGGMEVLEQTGFYQAAPQIASEALQLLLAPNCPSGTMDVVLAPDQMILQIHESIGHPLELDRILGDERNYAGGSFVTPEMLGHYRYGSELLNITFDPTRPEQFASYGFDDEGLEAKREYVIREGILLRALGGVLSQARSGVAGVASSRASSWNRPPIDRMANLNLEPGTSSLKEMIAAVERGVYMQTNCSWSIDDRRNKFQFGCEWGQLIQDGRLTTVVRNPNYRGLSATFWQSLKMVGNQDTFLVLGTPYCGKGEPNQAIRVGHASPACLFTEVEVFGGA